MASTTCGRCGHRVHMTIVGQAIQTQYWADADLGENPFLFQATFACDNCHRLSLCSVWTPLSNTPHGDDYAWDDGEWEPRDVQGHKYPHVPFHIADVADEAHRCHSIRAYRGSVLLARAVLEATAKDHKITTGRLIDKIDQMATQELISKRLARAAHEVRHVGNDAAHADATDEIGAVDSEDALTIMGEVLTEVYEGPARIAAMEERRARRQGGE